MSAQDVCQGAVPGGAAFGTSLPQNGEHMWYIPKIKTQAFGCDMPSLRGGSMSENVGDGKDMQAGNQPDAAGNDQPKMEQVDVRDLEATLTEFAAIQQRLQAMIEKLEKVKAAAEEAIEKHKVNVQIFKEAYELVKRGAAFPTDSELEAVLGNEHVSNLLKQVAPNLYGWLFSERVAAYARQIRQVEDIRRALKVVAAGDHLLKEALEHYGVLDKPNVNAQLESGRERKKTLRSRVGYTTILRNIVKEAEIISVERAREEFEYRCKAEGLPVGSHNFNSARWNLVNRGIIDWDGDALVWVGE